MRHRRLPALLTLALAMGIASPRAAQNTRPEPPRVLLGVPLSSDYRNADKALTTKLGQALHVELKHDDKFNTYGDLIERVITTNEQYLARMTPYAFVAAEMLGARLEVLATYESVATGTTTYKSYFVVNAKRFQEFPATLEGVYAYMKSLPKPARFVYHDKFSTSSYLLPALWFRTHRIFATQQPASSVLRVDAAQASKSSTESVDKVAADEVELAAVWDGTKRMYRENPAVLFIPLPLTLPNDLLVASTSLDDQTKADIRKAIDTSDESEIPIGDFKRWRNIDNAREALDALNELKRVARAAPAPVVVRVNPDTTNHDEEVTKRLTTIAEDARQAIRLAGTEFVLEEPKFHEAVDVIWTVKWIHDGAILLVSELQVPKEEVKDRLKQEFHVSFTPAEGDLTRRIVSLIHSRMHRIRYIWPYRDEPTVIRDVDFTIPKGEKVYVQRLTWRDPDRNDFVRAGAFDTVPAEIKPATFAFDKRDFVRTDTGVVDFQNPLSDVAYKVVLERRSNESTLSKVLAGTFVALFLLTGIGAAFDVRRRILPQKEKALLTLPEVCAALAARLHRVWTQNPLTDAGVVFCNRDRVEEQIEELKAGGLVPPSLGGITRLAYGFTASTSVPFMKGVFSGGVSRNVELVRDPKKVGNTLRLNALLDLMIRERLLSSFVGRPLEWEALNELARTILPGAEAGDLLIRPEDETVIKIASRHFRQVLDDGMKRLSLLQGPWSMSKREGRCLAQQRIALRGPILLGADRVSSVLLEFNIADEVELPLDAASVTLACWVLGKIVRLTIVDEAGVSTLCLHLRTVALLLGEEAGPMQLVTRLARDVDGLVQQGV